MLQLLDGSVVAPPPPVGNVWYDQLPAGDLLNNVQAPTGANAISLYGDFTVQIQGQNVPVYLVNVARDGTGYPDGGVNNQRPIGLCNFDTTGSVVVTVTVFNRTVTSYAVKTTPYGVQPTSSRSGNTITVNVPHYGKYIVQINGSEDNWLCLFCSPPEEAAPTGNVITYGPGIYTPGRVTLAANTTVWIKAGAVVHGSFIVPNAGCTIRGRGILCDLLDPTSGSTHFLETSGTGFTYEGFTMVGGQPFNIRMPGASYGLIDNVKIFSARSNSDAMDPTRAHHITIQNVFSCNWDDWVTLKDDGGTSCHDILVQDSMTMTRSGWRLMGFGAEGGGDIYNVTFKKIYALWTHAMNILHTETPDNPSLHDFLWEDITIEGHHGHQQTGLDPTTRFIQLGNDGGNSPHTNFTFRRVSLNGILPPSGLHNQCNGIHFEDLYVNGVKMMSDSSWNMSRNGAANVTYA